jgi:hypothetical protein
MPCSLGREEQPNPHHLLVIERGLVWILDDGKWVAHSVHIKRCRGTLALPLKEFSGTT